MHWRQIKPAEHGAWSLLLTPFLIGLGIALQSEHADDDAALAQVLFVLLAFAAFLVRQPVSALLRIWRGRGRRAGAKLAAQWTILLALVVVLSGSGLLALHRSELLLLIIPAAGALLVSLLIVAISGPRGLALEVVGSLGLALAAPGAYVAHTTQLDDLALAAWVISATHSLLSIFYVRLRVATRHDAISSSQQIWVATLHVLAFGTALTAAAFDEMPWLVVPLFALLMLRALWTSRRVPPLENVKRFGLAEMSLALLFALLIYAAY